MANVGVAAESRGGSQRRLLARFLVVVVGVCVGVSGLRAGPVYAADVVQPPIGTVVEMSASGQSERLDGPPMLYLFKESFTESLRATVTADGLQGTRSGEQYQEVSYPSNDFHPTACSSFDRVTFSSTPANASLYAMDDGSWELTLGSVPLGSGATLQDAPDCEYAYYSPVDPATEITAIGGLFRLQDSDPDPRRFAAVSTFTAPEYNSRGWDTFSITVSVESAPLPAPEDKPKPDSAADQCPMRPGVQKVECRATWVTLKKSKRGVRVTPNPAKTKVLINFGPVDGKGKKGFLRCSGACFVKLPEGTWWFNAQIRDTPRWLKSRAGMRPVKVGG